MFNVERLINVDSLKIVAIDFSFSQLMLPKLPLMNKLLPNNCPCDEHVLYSTWKFNQKQLENNRIFTDPPDGHIPFFRFQEYYPHKMTSEKMREFYLTTKLTFFGPQ